MIGIVQKFKIDHWIAIQQRIETERDQHGRYFPVFKGPKRTEARKGSDWRTPDFVCSQLPAPGRSKNDSSSPH